MMTSTSLMAWEVAADCISYVKCMKDECWLLTPPVLQYLQVSYLAWMQGRKMEGRRKKLCGGGGERRFEGGRGRMILETSWHNFVLVALHCFWSLECTTFGKKVSYFGLVAEISRNGRV